MKRMTHTPWLAFIIALILTGCASEVRFTATRFTPPSGENHAPITIPADIEVRPVSAYRSLLKAGMVWDYAGRIPEGAVYRVKNDVFMMEGANRHEAYCVVSDNRLVGFFLPVEQAFIAIEPTVSLLRK